MNVETDEPETIWHLEMLHPEELRKKTLPPEAQLVMFEIPLPALSRFFYHEVGKSWQWTNRLSWTAEQWQSWVEREEPQTWMLLFNGTPAGYFELEAQTEAVELAYFGLLPQFAGQGLGGGLLSSAIEKAWEMETKRVWVHTCSLDHPHALKNYRARGFRIYQETIAS